MVLFTLWDARGRRLPWVIAAVVLLGGYAAVDAVAAPAPTAQVARYCKPKIPAWQTSKARRSSVTSIDRVFIRATCDAHDRCRDHEVLTRSVWRCEGWWGGSCLRPWLTRPNYVFCGGVDYFMDRWDAKAHLVRSRNALYYGGTSGSAIRLMSPKKFPRSPYRTTEWK